MGYDLQKKVFYFYIFNGQHLVEIPSELFVIIENTVPGEWKIKVRNNGDIALWPSLFYEEDFLENFSESERKERNMFETLRQKIEQQN